MVARLQALKGSAGVNKWAESVGLAPSLVSSYLNGTRLPGAKSLRAIAARTGVSLDWLLLGDGGDAPRYRGLEGAGGTMDDLERAVAAYLQQCIEDAVRAGLLPAAPDVAGIEVGLVAGKRYEWFVNEGAVLGKLAELAIEDSRRAAGADCVALPWGTLGHVLGQVTNELANPAHRALVGAAAAMAQARGREARDAQLHGMRLAAFPVVLGPGQVLLRGQGGGFVVSAASRGAEVVVEPPPASLQTGEAVGAQ